jgi:tetratricopeptide (TPR) repeat protein
VQDRLTQLLKLADAEPTDTFVLYGIAQEYAKRAATGDALAWYDRCLAVDPNYCYAYFHKAKVLEDADRMTEAIATLRAGLERARACRDQHAASEIAAYLDQLT